MKTGFELQDAVDRRKSVNVSAAVMSIWLNSAPTGFPFSFWCAPACCPSLILGLDKNWEEYDLFALSYRPVQTRLGPQVLSDVIFQALRFVVVN